MLPTKASNMFVHIDDAHRDIPPTELLKERKVLFRFSSTQFDIELIHFDKSCIICYSLLVLQITTNGRRGVEMPNVKSAIKRMKTNEKRRIRNRIIKSHFKKAVKRVYLAMEQGDNEHISDLLKAALSEIDKAASKGTIHKNQAARRKSRLTLKVNHFLSEGK